MRIFSSVFGALLAALALAAGVAWMSYRTPPPPATLRLSGLSAPVRLAFDDGTPGTPLDVTVASLDDLWPALGAAQARDHLWTISLWRQAARSRLAVWFGDGALPVDRLTKRLALYDTAYTQTLTSQDREALERFVSGVNATLTTRRAVLDPNPALFRIALEPWTVSDVLAVERLAAWLAGRPFSHEAPQADRTLAHFAAQDRLLRDLLCADAFDQSRVLAYRRDDGVYLVAQWMTGSSALPVFPTVRVRVGDQAGEATLLPGTPFPLGGRLGAFRWAIRPVGTATVEAQSGDDGSERWATLTSTDGFLEEHRYVRRADAVLLGDIQPPPRQPQADTLRQAVVDSTPPPAPTPVPDSVQAAPAEARFWWVRWRGLAIPTDAGRWLALWRGMPQPPTLLAPAMIWTDGHAVRLWGDGPRGAYWAVLAPSSEAPYLAARLAQVLRQPGAVPEDDATSAWAEAWVAALRPRVLENRLSPRQLEALQYVRNWTFGYSAGDLAPTLIEAWEAEIRRQTGKTVDEAVADTGNFSGLRYTNAFRAAVDRVAATYGPDVTDWRWGTRMPATRHFPVASVASRLRYDVPAASRFRPLPLAGATHPTTLAFLPGDPAGHATAPLELRLPPSPVRDELRQLPPPSGVLATYRYPERPATFSLRVIPTGFTSILPAP
ncbi:MAG: penicillin acylase family protein [Bacteroidetes bacterium]|nr:penicillin acylase family protein [Bacteroidota bacterium]